METHEIKITKSLRDGFWIIRVTGITSGAIIQSNDCDDMTIQFKLDASRFTPVITKN